VEVPAAAGDCEHCGYGADCGMESLTAVLSSRFSVALWVYWELGTEN
jgi:hypothetical protein